MQHLRAAAWPATLAVVTVAGSLWASCLMPFTALAVIAAATLPTRAALVAVAGAWAVNQALGFTLLGFGKSPGAGLQGLFLLAATLAAFATAKLVAAGGWLRLGVGFLTGFTAFEVALYATSVVNDIRDMFTAAIVGQVALSEALWFALLVARSLLVQRTAPGLAPHRPLAPPA